MTWAIKQKAGNVTGKAILLMLANYANAEGECFPSHETIASDCECNRRSVLRWLGIFEAMGLIKREQRRRSDGTRTSDFITLNLSDTKSPSDTSKVTLCPNQSDFLSDQDDTESQHEPVIEPVSEPITLDKDQEVKDAFMTYVFAEYPKSPHTNRQMAQKLYLKLTKAKRQRCMGGVGRYAMRFENSYPEPERRKQLQFVKGLHKWIKEELWEQEYEQQG